jgi:hypothetical protein
LASVFLFKIREEIARSFNFLGILLLRLDLVGAPCLVAIVAAIVGIPAEHVPKFLPSQKAAAAKDARGEEPRGRMPSSLLVFFGKFFLRNHVKVDEETPDAGEVLAGGANMAALAAESAALRGEAVVCT